MINVEFDKQQEPSSPDLQYPVIMESTTNDAVILFSSISTGVTLRSNYYGVGYYSDEWVAADQPKAWKLYEGTIILSNE